MDSRIVAGLAAGAAGTVALNIATYADMAIRGRAASDVPAKLAGVLIDSAGIELQGEGPNADETAQNRRSGVGALMGYVTGLGVGMAYGLLRPQLRAVPLPLVGAGVGLAAMAASDVPATLAGATDPATWGTSGWLSDIGFHLVYGFTTAIAFEAFVEEW